MKRLWSLLLALVLITIPMLGLAEDWQTYEDPNGVYSFDYPSNYMLASKDTIVTMLDAVKDMLNEELTLLLEKVKPLIEQQGIVMLFSGDYQTSFTVTATPIGVAASDEMLLSMKGTVQNLLQSQLPGLTFTADAELVKVGDYSALKMPYQIEQDTVSLAGAQYYLSPSKNMFIFTVSTPIDQFEDSTVDLEAILETATLN